MRIIDLNYLSLEQSEATIMMVCPVIKCKSDGKYIIGTKLKAIIKQGNNLILKQGVSGSAECFKEYIRTKAKDQCYKIMNLMEEKKLTFT